MSAEPELWDGRSLGSPTVALAVFEGGGPARVLGAACTSARSVLLAQEQLREFLRAHAGATLVCHGAGSLHWLLYDVLRRHGDAAVADLWSFSRESRLIDVAILDQLIRQVLGRGCSRRNLRELASDAGVEANLPDDHAISQAVAAALPNIVLPEGAYARGLALRVADVIRQAYDWLLATAEEIHDAAEVASRVPEFQHRPSSPAQQEELIAQDDKLTELIRRVVRPRHEAPEGDEVGGRPYGPLGVWIEVQAAIATGWLARQELRVPGARWEEARRAGEGWFRDASADLHRDRGMRALFKWVPARGVGTGPLVRRDATGSPVTAGKPFEKWLRDRVPDEIRDVHHCPTPAPFEPEGTPRDDPDRWGPLAHAPGGLAAWRRLVRAARVASLPVAEGAARVAYETVPRLRAVAPLLGALREMAGPVFQPRAGNVFLVLTLRDLRPRCLAALVRESPGDLGSLSRRFASRGSLGTGSGEAACPVKEIASDFFVLATASDAVSADKALGEVYRRDARVPTSDASLSSREADPSPRLPRSRSGPPADAPGEWQSAGLPDPTHGEFLDETGEEESPREVPVEPFQALDPQAEQEWAQSLVAVQEARSHFAQLRADDLVEYDRWVRRTRDLLEALPLGLEAARLRELLSAKGERWQGMSAAEIDRHTAVFTRHVAPVLAAYLDLDLLNRLAEVLGCTTSGVVGELHGDGEPDVALRAKVNHLLHLRATEPVWQLIHRIRPTGPGGRQLGNEDVAHRLLWWCGVTPGGHVVGPGFLAAARRELYLAAADEVVKAVAYALVESGYPLAAVTEDSFLLEVPLAQASREYVDGVSRVVGTAQGRLLGSLAAPACWERVEAW